MQTHLSVDAYIRCYPPTRLVDAEFSVGVWANFITDRISFCICGRYLSHSGAWEVIT